MEITSKEIARSLGVPVSELTFDVLEVIRKESLSLRELTFTERDRLIVKIISRIREDKQVIASEGRAEVWERGWAENLELFRKNPTLDEALVPRFVRPGEPVRWFKEYYFANNQNFELSYIKILREFLVRKYFSSVTHLYEFGAGTGYNLLHANRIYPNLKLIGTDFVQSAVDLINEIATFKGIPLSGSLFDMSAPSKYSLNISSQSGILTFGSLEQLGGNIRPMFDFILANNPAICVHIEPVDELYDLTLLSDYLAYWFQTKRGYTAGLVTLLNELEDDGKIDIEIVQRLNFGSLMMEGYNLIVWRPRN